jgi:hypothetical protein
MQNMRNKINRIIAGKIRYFIALSHPVMKKNIFLFLFAVVSAVSLRAQGTTYTFPGLPVEFDYPADFKLQQDGKSSWTIFNEETGTEFYVNLYRTGVRFNADSLRFLMLKLYESDESVSNIQVNEVGTGSMGPHPAERFVLSFVSAEGKLYTCTAYLVHFWMNRRYNSFLFYFEIGEKNVISYAPIQEKMISSIRYKEFPYKKYTYQNDSVQIDYPDFWTAETIKGDSTEQQLLIDDGRCRILLSSYVPTKDTITVKMYADAERDKWKKAITQYRDLKISTGTEKIKETGDVIAVNSGSFNTEVQTVMRRMEFTKYIIRRKVGTRTKDFVIYFECPEMYHDYYEPVFRKMYASLVLPGTVVLPEPK